MFLFYTFSGIETNKHTQTFLSLRDFSKGIGYTTADEDIRSDGNYS